MKYVAGFLFVGSEVLLIKKAKPAWQKGRYNGVGGKVEEGENIYDAMRREFHEETSIVIPNAAWLHDVLLYGPNWEVHFFHTELQYKPAVTSQPDEPCEWFPYKGLPFVIPNLNWLIPMALDKTITKPVLIQDDIPINRERLIEHFKKTQGLTEEEIVQMFLQPLGIPHIEQG